MCSKRNKGHTIHVKALNIITNEAEAKAMKACDCKFKFNSTKCNSKQKWNKTCQW